MTEKTFHIAELLRKYILNELTETENNELADWLAEDNYNRELFRQVMNEENLIAGVNLFYGFDREGIAKKVALSYPAISENSAKTTTPVHRIRLLKTNWLKYAAAILIIFGIGAYLWNLNRSPQKDQVATTIPVPAQNDVSAPSVSRATLTLASGQRIFVDSAANGTLAVQGNVNIQKMDDGRIVYKGRDNGAEIQYNTLVVPRGSQIASIVLSDGSIVFLNAASSLRYPVSFNGNERRVEIQGEAYFEVTKDPKKKFIVSSGGITTEVLGTHFNVNTYPDESTMKVTLLEGSVKVSGGLSKLVIRPGDQVAFTKGVMQLNQSVDVDQVMAWKNGLFNFKDADLPTVLRQLERWYDIQVVYEGRPEEYRFQGEIQRSLNLSQVLSVLIQMEVKFTIEGKKITIIQ